MSAEGPVTVEGQAQIFHAGSDLDLSPFQPQATARWRRSVIGSAAEPHCLGFLRGHPQFQSLDRGDHAGYRQLRQADGSAPRRAPDQHQRVVGVVRQCRVRRHWRPKHRVVRNVPQQRTQHRILRDPAVHRPFSHPPATDGVDARTAPPPRYSGTRWNLRARHILSQGMLLKALTSDTANATQPRRLAPSTRERTRATASAVDRPLRKPNWLSCSPGSLQDKCDSRWAVAILSSSLLASSKRHTGRKAEGKSGERPSFHKTGNSPRDKHLSNRRINLGAKTPATSFHRRAGTPSGPGAFRAPILPTASANSSSVALDSGLQLPAVSCGSSSGGWGSCSSSSMNLTSSSFATPGNRVPTTSSRNRGSMLSVAWAEFVQYHLVRAPAGIGVEAGLLARPKPVSSLPWWLVAGASSLRGRPRTDVLLPGGPVGWWARAHRTTNRHLHRDVEVVREGLLRGHAPTGNTAGCGRVCPLEVHYGLAPSRHARAGRPPVHKAEVECGRTVLHVAPPSVGPTAAPRR